MRDFHKFLIASMAVHLLLLLFWNFPQRRAESPEERTIWIELDKKNLDIADILEPQIQERPKEYKFLGEFDSMTPEESVAARQGREDQVSEGEDSPRQIEKKTQPKEEESKEGIFSTKTEPKKDSTPNAALPEDFYPDFRRDLHTYLNVLRFPDVQYFVRLKRVFKLTFNPDSALHEAALTQKISRGQIEAVLGVSVDASGNLAEIFIFRSSGVSRYDAEAMRTIKSSAPFSAPPEKLLDADKLLRMSWTFVVYL